MTKQKSDTKVKKLVGELTELVLKDGAGLELGEKGFYHRAKANLHHFGGSIDKNSEMLERFKQVVLELAEVI